MVRAKFYVSEVKRVKWQNQEELVTICLHPVVSGSEENKEFYKYTPSGQIELGTINAEAAKQFELGKEFYVDFSLAE